MINSPAKKYVKGFVLNIYDALNYDIDFPHLTNNRLLYKVISNEYRYRNIMKNGELSNELTSYSYRCRLNGIEINANFYNRKQIKMYTTEIRKLLDRVDLYINVEIKGVDIFNRLLINIIIPELDIDLCDLLLDKSKQCNDNLFNKYIKKHKCIKHDL
jgi:hypothetical protein